MQISFFERLKSIRNDFKLSLHSPMVSLKKKSESLIKYYIKVTCALKWARKLPRKTETYESAKCVPCNTRKYTHNGFVSDLLKWALKCRFYATGPRWPQDFFSESRALLYSCISKFPRVWCLHVSWSPINNSWTKHFEVNVNKALQFELPLILTDRDTYANGRCWNHTSALLIAAVLLETGWRSVPYLTNWRVSRWR